MTARDYVRLVVIAGLQLLLAVVALGALPGCARIEHALSCNPRPGLLDSPECKQYHLENERRLLL